MARLTVGLVSCSKAKLPHAAEARDLYVSPLFRLARSVCEKRFDEWAILSAKFGLVLPDQVIEPYDVTLSKLPAERRKAWAMDVEHTIRATWTGAATFHVFAGKHYLQAVASLPHVDELHGLGTGHRLQRLSAMLREGP